MKFTASQTATYGEIYRFFPTTDFFPNINVEYQNELPWFQRREEAQASSTLRANHPYWSFHFAARSIKVLSSLSSNI